METAVRAPISERINIRLIVFIGVMLFLLGAPAYIYLNEVWTGGVHVLPDGTREVNLKAMSDFEMDQRNATIDDVPPQWRELDGQRVLLVGEIAPGRVSRGKSDNFQLVYSVAKCCYTTAPKVQHFVDSRVVDGKEVMLYPGIVRVVGTLRVKVIHEEGKVSSVYQLDVESVEPA